MAAAHSSGAQRGWHLSRTLPQHSPDSDCRKHRCSDGQERPHKQAQRASERQESATHPGAITTARDSLHLQPAGAASWAPAPAQWRRPPAPPS